MRTFDVVIVGGGPTGGLVGKLVSSQGFSVIILEEHNVIGIPVRCAGLISPRALKLAGVTRDVILNRITHACVHSPCGNQVKIGGGKTQALSIDRTLFDKEIIHQAVAEGAECWMGKKVIDIKKGRLILQTREEIGYRYLVGADGPRSIVAKKCGFQRPREILFGMNANVSLEHDPCTVDIYFGEIVAPGFFSWAIPAGDTMKAGLGVSTGHKPKKYFCAFLKKLKVDKIPVPEIGLIPLGPTWKPYQDNTAVVGDAAGQVKPSSGGGLYPGLVAAHCCSRALINALEDEGNLSNYPKEWASEIGTEIKKGLMLRRFFLRMNDKTLDKVLFALNNQEILSLINTFGDIDYPSKVVFQILIHHPQIMRFLPSLLV